MADPETPSRALQTPSQWAVRVHGVALFVLLIAAVPLCHAWQHEVRGEDGPMVRTTSTRERPRFSWRAFADGSFLRAAESWLQEDSPVTFVLRGVYREAQAALGVLQTPAVHVGPGGWMFQRPTLRPDPAALQRSAEGRRALFAAVRDEAAALDAFVLVAVVPDKVRVYPEEAFADGALPPEKRGQYALLLQELEGLGLPAVDLATVLAAAKQAMPEPLFERWDTHWSARGALVAMRAVAERLERDAGPRLGARTQVTLNGPTVVEALPDLVAQTGMRAERVFLAAADTWIVRPASTFTLRYLEPMQYFGVDVRDAATGRVVPLRDAAQHASVAVVGSSFSRAHGAGALAFALQRPVDARATHTGAVTVPGLREHFERLREGGSQARVVVWEFPERAMLEGLGAQALDGGAR